MMRISGEMIDATHLTLDRPAPFPPGARVMVHLIAADAESDEFAEASSSLLERAYGDNEPDYSDAGVPIEHEEH